MTPSTSSGPEDRPVILTEAEAAASIGVSISTFRRWRRNKTGPQHFHLGDIIRYRKDAVDAFVKAHTSKVA